MKASGRNLPSIGKIDDSFESIDNSQLVARGELKSNRICNKNRIKEIIKSWWWCCVHLLGSPRIQTRIFSIFFLRFVRSSCRVVCAPLFTTSLRDELSWFCLTFFYIRRECIEKEKKLRSRWYSIGIGWLKFFYSAVDGPRVLSWNFQCYKVCAQTTFGQLLKSNSVSNRGEHLE